MKVKTVRTADRYTKWALALVMVALGFRLISLGWYPLFDTTEARYGEIARIMFETQNWVTPFFDYNVPFWGKPPLHTWITSQSFAWFGVGEFTARLPHFACSVLVLCMVYRLASRVADTRTAQSAVLVLSSTLGFLIASGMVMTDAALLFAVTLAMVSFWFAFSESDRLLSGHLFFVGLALGMLIKGPVAIVLVGIALVCWSVQQRCFKKALLALPWPSGLLLFLLLTLPWYLLAELRTPGFLEYFFVGEHVQRFLVPGWEGDLYGSAHTKPRGTIVWYWLLGAFPWSLALLGLWLGRGWRREPLLVERQAHFSAYLMCWMLAPIFLFMMAGNIVPAYVLPGFGGLAVLVALNLSLRSLMLWVAAGGVSLFILMIVLFSAGLSSKESQADLLGGDRSFPQHARLYYWEKRPFSARFYSKGQAQLLDDPGELTKLVNAGEPFYLALPKTAFAELHARLAEHCVEQNRDKKRLLLSCHVD